MASSFSGTEAQTGILSPSMVLVGGKAISMALKNLDGAALVSSGDPELKTAKDVPPLAIVNPTVLGDDIRSGDGSGVALGLVPMEENIDLSLASRVNDRTRQTQVQFSDLEASFCSRMENGNVAGSSLDLQQVLTSALELLSSHGLALPMMSPPSKVHSAETLFSPQIHEERANDEVLGTNSAAVELLHDPKRLSWVDEVEGKKEFNCDVPNMTATSIRQPSPGKWVTAVKGQQGSTMHLHYHAPQVLNGVVRVKPPVEAVRKGAVHWENTLVGYFLDKKLPFPLVHQTAIWYWGKENILEVLSNDNGFFFFRFHADYDISQVLTGGPWYFAGRPLILRKWKPGLVLNKEAFKTIPIWVNFYNLPLEAWTEECLSYVASAIGKPLFADRMEEVKRIKYARVCIEVNAESSLPDKIEFELEDGSVKIVDVEYGWVPKSCTKCMAFGHLAKNCTKIGAPVWKHREVKEPTISMSQPSEDGWTKVSHRGKAAASTPISVHSPSLHEASTSNEADQIQVIAPSAVRGGEIVHESVNNSIVVHNSFQCLEEGLGVEDDHVTPSIAFNLRRVILFLSLFSQL